MSTHRSSDFARRVAADRAAYALPLQAQRLAEDLAHGTLALLFPHFARPDSGDLADVEAEIAHLRAVLERFVREQGEGAQQTAAIDEAFVGALPVLREALVEDARATWEADPAAQSIDEVLLAYPGFYAIACYRIAHVLHGLGGALLPRLITELAHRETGIDIHPGARIGRALAIDHGTGIVIGETAVIGDRVRLYQGVTIGALSVRKEFASQKRHPTIEDDVVIYANATILGGDAVIGARSVIGGNVWLTHAVPPGSVVTHAATVERPRQVEEPLLEYHI